MANFEPSQTTGAAFDLYSVQTLPHLRASGGELLYPGHGGPFLIGPEGAGRDCAMLVREDTVEVFLAHAGNEAYLDGIGHRTAALEGARPLPLEELDATGF